MVDDKISLVTRNSTSVSGEQEKKKKAVKSLPRVTVQLKTEHFMSQSSTSSCQAATLHHRGDVFTPNALLICQQGGSTILGEDIKAAKSHLYANNKAFCINQSTTELFKHISLHFYRARFHVCTLPFCSSLLVIFVYILLFGNLLFCQTISRLETKWALKPVVP